MDDIVEVMLSCVVGALLFVMLIGLVYAVKGEDTHDEKKQDKRYELCLKRDMQWVEGNCIAK